MEANKEVQSENSLRCKSSTDANKLAGSIYSTYQGDPSVPIIIKVIGAGALNQAVKAVIISNKFFSKKGLSTGVTPFFLDAEKNVTAIGLKLVLTRN